MALRSRAVLDALMPRLRQDVLRLFLSRPETRLHLRDTARQTGRSLGALQRELASLTKAGILTREADGNRTYYRANPACPVLPELAGLVRKTVGLVDVLREALAPLGAGIQSAFVYGSFARGDVTPASDVDLMVIGDVDDLALHAAVAKAEESLRRRVDYSLWTAEEFRRRRRERGGFLARVLRGPKLDILGNLDGVR
jgi:predicted nucleotidyltransferase